VFTVAVLTVLGYSQRLAGRPDPNLLYKYSTAVGAVIVYAILLLGVLAMASFRREPLALRAPRSVRSAAGLTALVLVGIYLSVLALDPLLHGGREQGYTPAHWMPSHAGAYAANFVVLAGVAPVVEELMFRGLGFTLLARFGAWPAILGVGVAFALAHGLLQAFPELLIFGSGLAWLRSRVDSVYPGMIVHSAFNSIALIVAVATTHH
jgi:membrane protease YdiL (CAAX protease family)